MLSILNSFSHGYVAIPVIDSCAKRGLFKLLSCEHSQDISFLVESLKANAGYFDIAMNMLECLGWVKKTSKDHYLMTAGAKASETSQNLIELYKIAPKDLLTTSIGQALVVNHIQRLLEEKDLSHEQTSELQAGALLLPLLVSLKDAGSSETESLFPSLPAVLRDVLYQLFIRKKWAVQEKEKVSLTTIGKEILDRVDVLLIAASYRPMLAQMDQILFGNSATVFEPDETGEETYVDRTMNVLASGMQHKRYFKDAEAQILHIFNQLPIENQPKYIADMGCGDGSFLKQIYLKIQQQSKRGNVLDQFPIKLIGIDYNQAALKEAETTLDKLPHLTLFGDINQPEQLIEDLKAKGIENPEEILHIHSFLDHTLKYAPSNQNVSCSEKRFLSLDGVYVDSKGKGVSAPQVYDAWKQHLQKWSRITTNHGLLLLESHCLPIKEIQADLNATESFCFDTLHAFSRQYLISAEMFLTIAATVGLFTKKQPNRYPKALSFCQVTLSHFEKRKYTIRFAEIDDITFLNELENLCWPRNLRTSNEKIKRRLETYPQGQFVLEQGGIPVGAIYSQRINNIKELEGKTTDNIHSIHNEGGPIVQLLAINIHPDIQNQRLGDQLLEFMLQRCALMNGVSSVIGITLCKDYKTEESLSFTDYVNTRNEQGDYQDPILQFHYTHGATIKGILAGYRPQDIKNEGNGVLITYDIRNRTRNEIPTKSKSVLKINSQEIDGFIEHIIKTCLGKDKELAFSKSQPLMEMGLDSADLLKLTQQISYEFQVDLEPEFFFQYNTFAEVCSFLKTTLSDRIVPVSKETGENKVEKKPEAVSRENNTRPHHSATNQTDIAIIGASCHLPGEINTPAGLWDLLKTSSSVIGEMPESKLQWPSGIDPLGEHIGISKGGFINDTSLFDASFFRISPMEAETMDPQQRILLELSWHCLENAGYSPETLSKSNTGVFIGASGSDYSRLHDKANLPVTAHFGTSGSMSILANRISYFYNFTGPSIQTDTACSSSLVAVHQAVRTIWSGECNLALVGGVNIICHPSNSIAYYKSGMLAKDGKCKTFDKEANGYVRSEGAVTLLLKSLSNAVSAGDQIYAVIKGTASNHGGQSAGLTVPNPEMQAKLIQNAWQKAGVAPETLGYIEAHGTGTSLGDPIEIRGIKNAFSTSCQKRQFQEKSCGLGSLKSNLGHLEAAAGITGLLKVALCLKHKELVPTINFKTLNPQIELDESPFYIVTQRQKWPAPKSTLRRAGVSSFGSGGTNAHVVLEEYRNEIKNDTIPHDSFLFIFSAKNEERLCTYAKTFAIWLNSEEAKESLLPNIAYVLQTGRQALDERLAIIASNKSELISKLKDFYRKDHKKSEIWTKNQKGNHFDMNVLLEGNAGKQLIDSALNNKDLDKLAIIWTSGMEINWKRLYSPSFPFKITLPNYPFLRDSHWIQAAEEGEQKTSLHPLLHQNTSDLEEQRFSSTFNGQEFFLSDHRVNGKKVLPGVCYLEMARAAVEKAAAREADGTSLQLKNVVWTRPIAVNHSVTDVHIALFEETRGQIQYEVYTVPENEEEGIVHSQGIAEFKGKGQVPALDIQGLRSQMNRGTFGGDTFYQACETLGLHYGLAHQAIMEAYLGDNQILARLTLPSSVENTLSEYVLHPSLMDAALQSSIGLTLNSTFQADRGTMLESGKSQIFKPSLPFALQSLEIVGLCSNEMFAWVRYADGSNPRSKIQKLDIDLCNAQGEVCAKMKGFSSRVLEGGLEPETQSQDVLSPLVDDGVGLNAFLPVWNTVPAFQRDVIIPFQNDHLLLLGGTEHFKNALQTIYPNTNSPGFQPEESIETIREALRSILFDQLVWIAPSSLQVSATDEAMIHHQRQGVLQVFRIIKALLSLGYGQKELVWTLVTFRTQRVKKNDPVNPTHAAIHGLIGSLAKEYSQWKLRLLDLENEQDLPLQEMFAIPADAGGNALAYRRKEWFRQELVQTELRAEGSPPYKSKGVYVVIGGAGGIGEAWTRFMIETYQANIIWIGRRKQNEALQAKLDLFSEPGPKPLYISADATDLESLKKAALEIKKIYPRIDGVIHSAIVLKDQSLATMEEETFRSGLAAKLDVSVRLAQVFQQEPLDFILFFSSMLSFGKTPGQSNYVAGCTFKDAFAHKLSMDLLCTVKVMNWGYWGSVGIVTDQSYQDRMKRAGIGSIEPEEAMESLTNLLLSPFTQIAQVKTFKPQALEGVKPDERVTSCAETLPSFVHEVQENLPEVNSWEKPTNSSNGHQYEEMERFFLKLLWTTLASIGLFEDATQTIADLNAKGPVPGYFERWLQESIRVLLANGFLQTQGEKYISIHAEEKVHPESVWNQWEAKKAEWMQYPDQKAQVLLADACLKALPDILTGKKQATDVIFPNSSMELVEGIYKGNIVSDYFNEVLSKTLVTAIQQRLNQDPLARMSILEIGAGTGGTTATLLPYLDPFKASIQEYCYTDLSKAFLIHAEQTYAPERPYLSTRIFDVSKALDGQPIDPNRYDFVIATNVLHATRNIRETLRNTKATLHKHGLLFLNELSVNSLFTHLTFGLLEGWWLHEDTAFRIEGCPVLTPENWSEILVEEGFQQVFFPAKEARALGQQIIVAESDGVIRQKKRLAPDIQQPIPKTISRKNTPQNSTIEKQLAVKKSDLLKTNAVTDQMIEDYVKDTITEQLSESLKVNADQIDHDEPFSDYGLDSITGVNFVQMINRAFKIELDTTSIFDYNSVDQLTSYVLSIKKNEISKSLELDRPLVLKQTISLEKNEDTPAKAKPKRFRRNRFVTLTNVEEETIKRSDAIAIIGISGRFAKSETLDVFWQNLVKGMDLVEKVSRWDLPQCSQDRSDKDTGYCEHGSFLDGIDQFDPTFFKISDLEATYMDPQQRLFLEESWKALENAGYVGDRIKETLCGIYVGCRNSDYSSLFEDTPPPQAFWGNASSIIPARIAYYLNLQGPAIAIDTACSSSLVATHMACQGLRTKETDLALAGGVFIQCTSAFYQAANPAGMLSPTGRCHTFDAKADGFVPGEGVGVIVLKRYTEAVSDGDHIYGMIRGSGINQDGSSNGITAPSAKSQERLQRQVYDRFEINPETIQMMEAHGTGTKLGDPIEYSALTRSFRHYTNQQDFCALGSVKTNIGHSATAAGIAGVLKIVLSLQHQQIPPSLHFESGNPAIQFQGSPFYVNTELKTWKPEANATPRRAAISSFGFSGTNAHLVMEEAPESNRVHSEKSGYLIVLSARNSDQLHEQVSNLVKFCKASKEIDLGNLSYTLLIGRKHWNHRLFCVVRSLKELVLLFEKWLKAEKVSQICVSKLQEDTIREQASLKRYGNQCIQECDHLTSPVKYLEHLSTIGDLYIQGYTLDFNLLFLENYTTIPLPNYPFAKERYWVPDSKTDQLADPGRDILEKPSWDQLAYILKWQECPALVSHNPEKSFNVVLLVYSDSSLRFEKTILDYYKSNHPTTTVIQVCLGSETQQISENEWYCGTNDLNGFAACISGFRCIDAVFFISAFPNESDAMDWDHLTQSPMKNEIQLLRLVKLLKQENKIDTVIDCFILTLDNYQIDETPTNPYGGGLTGIAYSLAQGDHRFLVRNIDMSLADLRDSAKQRNLLKKILKEEASDRGKVIRYESGCRYQQSFFKLNSSGYTEQAALKNRGVYVILGGSGTVGRLMTHYLIQKYRARVVWIGRTPETSQALQRKIESFREWGEPPLYVQADTTCLAAMRQAVKKIKMNHPVINGAIFSGLVFHSENSIVQTTEADFKDILDVKSKGSCIFYNVFEREPLDFMCYFSSAQSFSFLSAKDTVGYASGITFSDTFVKSLEQNSPFPIGIINWGYWNASFGGTAAEKRMANKFDSISNDEGFCFFERFIDLVQRGILNQLLCLKASELVQQFMNANQNESVFIAEKSSVPSIQLLSKTDGSKKNEKTDLHLKRNNQEETNEFNEWILQLLFLQIQSLGIFSEKGIWEDIDVLRKKAGVLDKYRRWWEECCLGILAGSGYLQRKGRQVQVSEEIKLEKAEKIREKWKSLNKSCLKNPEMQTHLSLIDDCLYKLPEILRGATLATDVLFPDSSIGKVENMYKRNVRSDHFNMIVADIASAYVKQQIKVNPHVKIRIIEIGAGTGGTTSMVLPQLTPFQDHIEAYCYTDISKAFLMHGEKHFGQDYPFLEYKIWNIETPLADQGIAIGTYDIVIATNVLHATRNIRQTLKNTKAALKQNGILILNEIVEKTVSATMIFGLLDGWWLYEDEDIRIPGSPLLNLESWKSILKDEGFGSVLVPESKAYMTDQRVMVVESDGLIKQKTVKRRVKEKTKEGTVKTLSDITSRQPEKVVTDSISEHSASDLREYVTDHLHNALCRSLRVGSAGIENDIPFSDYGVDSILGSHFINQVKDILGITLNTAIIFDYATIDRLVNHILETYNDQIDIKQNTPRVDEGVQRKERHPVKRTESKSLHRRNRKSLKWQQNQDSFSVSEAGDIAVIGMSGQFPGAKDVNTYWNNLAQGKDGVCELPAHYLDQKRYFSPNKRPNTTYCRWGGILEDRDCFDPLFFNFSPTEATSMNPHQRLILQESWRGLEDAGYNPKNLKDSRVGVYIGAEPVEYPSTALTGSSDAIIASRLSYYLDLKGPAFVVNTGCSSSGVAIHLACESLRHGETNMALAGGVFAVLEKTVLIGTSTIGILSPTGKCYTFDERADGTVLSESVGIVVLKRRNDAVLNGDHIYGIIKGSGVNQDGASNGITAPNGIAQEQLITDVYKQYQIDPEEISYIEAHGTGTKLGDPVEGNALVRSFKRFSDKKGYCALGSAKSHIGHTGAAAAVVGLIKILLSIKNQKIPGLLHYKKLNPLIEFDDSAFFINTETSEWKSNNSKPLMAALNSFGHSGTNVHLVVREYVPPRKTQETAIPVNEYDSVLIPLSARKKANLKAYAEKLCVFLESVPSDASPHPDFSLTNLAYTLQVGREPMNERVIFLANNISQLIDQLTSFYQEKPIENCWQGRLADGKGISLFTSKEDTHEIILKWIAKGELRRLAEFWVNGFAFDWDVLYGKEKPQRISIPTYSFSRKRYWYDSYHTEIKEQEESGAVSVEQDTKTKTPSDEAVGKEIESGNGIDSISNFDEPINEISPIEEANGWQQTSEHLLQLIGKDVGAMLSDILKMELEDEVIDINQPFHDFGLTSINIAEFLNKINQKYGTEVSIEFFFDLTEPTVFYLSKLLYSQFESLFSSYYSRDKTDRGIESQESEEQNKSTEGVGGEEIATEVFEQIETDILTVASRMLQFSGTGYLTESVDRFVNELNEHFDLMIPANLFLENPSVGSFIKNLTKDYPAAFIKHYNKNEFLEKN